MIGLLLRSALAGLVLAIVAPIVVFFLVLGTAYLVDPRCGTPGDSGGCEMGSAAIALASIMPAFAIGFAIVFIVGLMRMKRHSTGG